MKDAPDNARKYAAKSTFKGFCDILEFDITDLQDENIKAAFVEAMDYLKMVGHLIIKNKKDRTEANNLNHIKYLEQQDVSNQDKIRYIRNNYNLPVAEHYLIPFLKKIVERYIKQSGQNVNLARQIRLFYSTYCKVKHRSATIYGYKNMTDKTIELDDSALTDINLAAISVFLSLDTIKEILGK